MKISYGLTVCNEHAEIKNLLYYLKERIDNEDEIVVVYDQNRIDDKTMEVLSSFERENYKYLPFNFQQNFLENKNYMNSQCSGNYIFQIDADEIPEETLIQYLKTILQDNSVDLIVTPRKNLVSGLTQEHIRKWGWIVNEKGWVNWPDAQKRIYKNDPNIKWTGHQVHGMITGYNTFAVLPLEEEWSIIHNKTIERQEKQNDRYDKIDQKNSDIKVYTFFSDTHKIFLQNYIDTFPFEQGIDLQIRYLPQECSSGDYHSHGWKETMKRKLDYIITSLDETSENEIFVHSDIDIQFFGKIKDDLTNLIRYSDKDILFQDDGNAVCMGFFVCKKNKNTLRFFKTIYENLHNFVDDQIAANFYLKDNIISFGVLPERYYTVGVKHSIWDGSNTNLIIPKDLIMHHANYTVGIQNKLNLLKLVKAIYNEK